MGIETVIEVEKQLDADITGIQLLHKPIREALSALHTMLHGAVAGSKGRHPMQASDERASAIALRLSYVMPFLATCPTEPLDVDLIGPLDLATVANSALEPLFLLQYGHFSQFMPEVHRGYFIAEGDSPKDIVLSHASQNFADQEARDVIFTELSLTYGYSSLVNSALKFDRLIASGPPYPRHLADQLLKALMVHWKAAIFQPPLTRDGGFTAAVGATLEEFGKFQAAAISLADYCRGIVSATGRRIDAQRPHPNDELLKELYNWNTACWPEARVEQLLCQLSRLPKATVNRLMGFFVWDFSQGRDGYQQFGDGFTPPFTRVDNHLLFSPEVLRRFVSVRNVLYALNRHDRATFDNVLSHEFEPALLDAAQKMFSQHESLELLPNVSWLGKGEFDLLVFDSAENTALHLQAKATLPPQGARMVKAVEDRLTEGLRQLAKFRELSTDDADQVLSNALGRKVTGVHVVDVLLSSSSLGTDHIWSRLGDVVPLNLSILSLVLRAADKRGVVSLREFPKLVDDEIKRLVKVGKPKWTQREWVYPGANIWVPMLDFDVAAISRERVRAAEGHLWGQFP